VMIIVPLPFDFVAFSLAAASILVPFAGVTLAMNQALAPKMLNEKLTRTDIVATCVILFGCTLTTVSGSHEETSFTACDLLEMYGRPSFVASAVVLNAALAFCVYCTCVLPSDELRSRYAVLQQFKPVMFGVVAGGVGAQQNIVFKATGELAKSGLAADENDGTWATFTPYAHIMMVIALSVTQFSFINRGLAEFDAVVYLPVYNCLYIVLAVSVTAVYYEEYDNFSVMQAVGFIFGILATLCGVAMLTLGKRPRKVNDVGGGGGGGGGDVVVDGGGGGGGGDARLEVKPEQNDDGDANGLEMVPSENLVTNFQAVAPSRADNYQ